MEPITTNLSFFKQSLNYFCECLGKYFRFYKLFIKITYNL